MVASTSSPRSTESILGLNDTPVSALNKCRYKTGKCTNARSSKRNGQPHQLCLFHRDKANKIQRKFDRQKRQVARSKKTSETHSSLSVLSSPTSASMLDIAALAGLTPAPAVASPVGSRYSSSSPSSSTASLVWMKEPMHTPASVDCRLHESLWTTAVTSYEYHNVQMRYNQSYLSVDEIDFLCSAILE